MRTASGRRHGMVFVDVDRSLVMVLPPSELDLATEAWLTTVLERVEALTASEVVVDMSHVRFADARSTSILAESARRLRRSGRSLRLRSASPGVHLAARLCGVADELGLPAAR